MSLPLLQRIRIILIETSHPGNIGAVARAMKNMGLTQMVLVNPRHYPSPEATARASGADDLLARAVVTDSLDQALHNCRLAIGTSARLRSVAWTQHTPRQSAAQLLHEAQAGEVALLFGRESSGLSNLELDRCQSLVHIPANPAYSSLNLAQAVQILSYELRTATLSDTPPAPPPPPVATRDAMEGFYRHLQQTLIETGFADPQQSDRLQRRLRRLFDRARPDRDELNILRGLLSAAQGRKSMRRE